MFISFSLWAFPAREVFTIMTWASTSSKLRFLLKWKSKHLSCTTTFNVRVLTDLNGPDQPHWGVYLHPCPWTQEPHFSSALGCQSLPELCCRSTSLQLNHSHTCAWPWTLRIQTLTSRLTCQLDSRPALSLRTCPAIAMLYPTLVTVTEPDSDQLIDFLAWFWSCLISTKLPDEIWILGRTWLLSPSLPRSPCSGTVGPVPGWRGPCLLGSSLPSWLSGIVVESGLMVLLKELQNS